MASSWKYIKKGARFAIAGEEFNLSGSDANDLSRRDVVEDLMRIETLVRSGSLSEGHVVLVTNEPALWSTDRGEGSQDRNFRLNPGRVLHGELSWTPTARSAPARGAEPPISIKGEYEVKWSDFSSLAEVRFGVFRYLALPVLAGSLAP